MMPPALPLYYSASNTEQPPQPARAAWGDSSRIIAITKVRNLETEHPPYSRR